MNLLTLPMRPAALAAALLAPLAFAGTPRTYELSVDKVGIELAGQTKSGIGYNGRSPGPVLRFREGDEVVIKVTNNLDKSTSIHWHGLIVPFQMDGVPTISFPGIAPGETFTYRFPIVQSGTYWYHSHSPMQEPDGAYGAIVIEPKDAEPFSYDRDYVIQLADMHPHPAARIMRNLKMMPDYYSRQQQTVGDFFSDVAERGLSDAVAERRAWGEMRMMRTDIEDVHGFVGLINGHSPQANWTGLFTPGERIRLRLINSSAMTNFDIRIPGLALTVVQADGNNVEPVTVSELRIAVAETYDVVVQPEEARAYTIFAESMGRSGFARGTLAPRDGMQGEIPALREPPLLTMADMGMVHGGMGHGAAERAPMEHGAAGQAPADPGAADHAAMGHGTQGAVDHAAVGDAAQADVDHAAMGHAAQATVDRAAMGHGAQATVDHAAMGHGAPAVADPFYAPGSGLLPAAADGGKFLSYSDLRAQKPLYALRDATREIELRLTGNMERYIWSINGIKYDDAEPIRLRYGERVRFKFVNETMMAHPMHLHGMWSILDTGAGQWNPIKHVINVAPGTTVYMETEVDAPGEWAFHCHLAYHAASGMFRKVVVEGGVTQRRDSRQRPGRG